MSHFKGSQHNGFIQFIGSTLNHKNGITCSGYTQIEIRLIQLLVGWIYDEIPMNASYSYSSNWTSERDVRDHQCCRGAINTQDINGCFTIRRNGIQDHLNVVPHILWK